MIELPCNLCGAGYGQHKPNWCPLLGREIKTVADIPHYYSRIPDLGKSADGCMGFMPKMGDK
jgi:hypothetical protein